MEQAIWKQCFSALDKEFLNVEFGPNKITFTIKIAREWSKQGPKNRRVD